VTPGELAFEDGAIAGYWLGAISVSIKENVVDADLNGNGDKIDIVNPPVFLFRENTPNTREIKGNVSTL